MPLDDAPSLEAELSQLIADQEAAADDAAMAEQDFHAYSLEIRRSDGTEVVSISGLASRRKWSVCLQSGGNAQTAYLGTADSPLVWANTWDHSISRDEDGTYFICID